MPSTSKATIQCPRRPREVRTALANASVAIDPSNTREEKKMIVPSTGNRMPVPAQLESAHFFYKTVMRRPGRDEFEVIVNAAMCWAAQKTFETAEIAAPTLEELGAIDARSFVAVSRVTAENLSFPTMGCSHPTLLMCEWAQTHADESFAGSAFASLVLHTGPHPYVMETFTTIQNHHGLQKVCKTQHTLSVGDVFVFDPTTPHMATPTRPSDGQRLILLQVELPDSSEGDRQRILEFFPPVSPSDR